MFECINSCSTALEQTAVPRTDINAHRWRRLQAHGKQRWAGPRVGALRAEDVSLATILALYLRLPGCGPHACRRKPGAPSSRAAVSCGVSLRRDTNRSM